MNNEERWKYIIIDNFDDYEISDHGRVASYKQGRRKLLTPTPDKDGYMRVTLTDNNHKAKTLKVHRLVAIHFVPNPNGYEDVNHIDDIPYNNHYTNLVWCSSAFNTAYRTDKNFNEVGYMNKTTRPENVSELDKQRIKDMYFNLYLDPKYICEIFNIGEYCFRVIIHGSRKNYSEYKKTHTPIMREIEPEIKVVQRRLSDEEVLEIYNKINNLNISPREIMREFGISKSNVSSIKHLKIHKELISSRLNPDTNRIIIFRKMNKE